MPDGVFVADTISSPSMTNATCRPSSRRLGGESKHKTRDASQAVIAEAGLAALWLAAALRAGYSW